MDGNIRRNRETCLGSRPVRGMIQGCAAASRTPPGDKAKCDKRNRHRLIALALAAMFALAGSAANAQSSLTGENAKELERLLAVPAET